MFSTTMFIRTDTNKYIEHLNFMYNIQIFGYQISISIKKNNKEKMNFPFSIFRSMLRPQDL